MAYSPHTWVTNEVITKNLLNALELGAADGTTLDGTDIDVDKDWNAKSVSNMKELAVTDEIEVGIVTCAASESLLKSGGGGYVTLSNLYQWYPTGVGVVVPEGYYGATFRIKLDLWVATYGPNIAVGRNGSVIHTTDNGALVSGTYSYDVGPFKAGDLIQAFAMRTATGAAPYGCTVGLEVYGTPAASTVKFTKVAGSW